MKPGEILPAKGELELNVAKNRNPITIEVANTGDRPIQVGSHYHFFETNEALKFDRKRVKGMRLDIAAGTAVRFEPGQSRTVRPSRAPSRMKSVISATDSGWLSLTPRSSLRRATMAAMAISSLSFSRGVRFMSDLPLS